jgi:hypothetical protein
MPVALRVLPKDEEVLRGDKMQTILGAGHRDIEQPPFFFDLSRRAGAEIGGNAAVHSVQDKDRVPLLSLG